MEGVLYFIGCTTSYFTPNVAKATLKVFEKAKLKYKVLRGEERCCGFPLFATGQIDAFKRIADLNMELLKERGVEKIVTTCPSCYRTIKLIYPEFLGGEQLEVIHFPDFALKLIENGFLQLNRREIRVTYHDPCELGRKLNIYDSPRKLIKSIPGVKLVEMERIRENSWCCGAGGVVRMLDTKISTEIASKRIKRDVAPLNVDALVTSCPACIKNLSDGVMIAETIYDVEPVRVLDVAELLADAL